MPSELVDRFTAIGSLSDQFQVRLVRQQGGDTLAEEEMIVDRRARESGNDQCS